MPTHDEGAPSAGYANTNGSLRKEIKNDLVGQIKTLSQVMTTANSIVTSDSFHLDSRKESNRWKVEIQYKRGSGGLGQKTVAVVLVETNATSLADFQAAVANALTNAHVWRVS